jgi:hypothetical protein
LRRTLGETVSLETVLAAGLWQTHADPKRLDRSDSPILQPRTQWPPRVHGQLEEEAANECKFLKVPKTNA